MSAFDHGLAYQGTPEQPEYPAYDVEIVSPELPCGSAWLINCLLELDVPIWKPWNAHVDNEWQRLGTRRYRYVSAAPPWRRTLPALSCGREFRFRAMPVPRVLHYWPGAHPPVARTILFVRDPRDALYSAWRREAPLPEAARRTFAQFVGARYFHYPFTRAEYLLLFLRLWREALREREHLVLRFEDYRNDAIATLRRATAFLGIDADDMALARAAENSDFARLRQIESSMLARGEIAAPLNRAARAFEHRATFDRAMHVALGPRYAQLYTWLGYDADRSAAIATAAFPSKDTAAVRHAMLLEQFPQAAQDWYAKHLAEQCADIPLQA